MIQLRDVKDALGRLRNYFEQRGINSETQIARHIAFLLLVRHQDPTAWQSLRNALPSHIPNLLDRLDIDLRHTYRDTEHLIPPPSDLPPFTVIDVLIALQDALKGSNDDAGLLFQRFVRFELFEKSRGGQYPTPRHIADTMAALIDLHPQVRLIDPTCGTAGLLVAAHNSVDQGDLDITGYDYNREWAWLGWSNLVLNGHDPAKLHIFGQSALLPWRAKAQEKPSKFNRLLMNPPFNGRPSADEIERAALDPRFGSRNEIFLTAYALQRLLEDGGRGATLVSRGVLFGGGAEAVLRAALMPHIEAIVTLPPDAFQPYNGTSAHLLLFQKQAVPSTTPVWFVQLQHDGYGSGKGRNLSEDPTLQNDLPLLVTLIETSRSRLEEHAAVVRGEDESILARIWALAPEQNLDRTTRGALAALADDTNELSLKPLTIGAGGLLALIQAGDRLCGWLALAPHETVAISGSYVNSATFDPWTLPLPDTTVALPQQWSVTAIKEGETTTCRYERDGDRFLIEIGRDRSGRPKKTLELRQAGKGEMQLPLAHLLDEQGRPLSPLLHLPVDGEELSKHFEPKSGFERAVICNINGQEVGFILTLAPENAETANGTLAYLLLWTEHELAAYHLADGGYAFMLDPGLLLLRGTTPDRIEPLFGTDIPFRASLTPRALALTRDGRAVGVQIARGTMKSDDSWEPREYLVAPSETVLDRPADILGRIRKHQVDLRQRIDGLLGMIAVPADRAAARTPLPPLLRESYFSNHQRELWRFIAAQIYPRAAGTAGEAEHFDATALFNELPPEQRVSEDEWMRQLMLFEKLGLIIKVTVDRQQRYRLATLLDEDILLAKEDTDKT